MSLTEKRVNYKPFEYPEVMTFIDAINKSFWVHSEVDFTADIQDFHANLSPIEKEVVKRSLLGIAQVEVGVKTFWGDLYKHFPKPELNNLGMTFAECEVRHAEAYSRLLEVLGLNNEFENLVEIPVFKSKLNLIEDNLTSKHDIISKLLFFTIVIENTSLFSQFANILSFTRFKGYMKNVSNIIGWTSIDEQCFPLGTKTLTPSGWKNIEDIKIGDLVYGFKEGEIKLERVINTVKKPFDGNLINVSNSRHNITTTPNHDFIYIKDGEWKKEEVKDVKFNNHMQVPITGSFISSSTSSMRKLTYEDRLKIAIQADGGVSTYTLKSGEQKVSGVSGGKNVAFNLRKTKKIERLEYLLKTLGIEYTKTQSSSGKEFYIKFYYNLEDKNIKSLSWVLDGPLSKKFCEDFIEECILWDGSTLHGDMNYTSTNKENIEIVEQIAILAGYRTSIYMNKDSERSEKFSNCYKLSFSNKDKGQVLGGSYLKTEVPYSGDVACVTVPSGGIIVKQGDKSPFITGNCHANAGIYLINKYYEEDEFFETKKSEIETNIKNSILDYISYEERLLDWIYEEGELEFFTKKNMLDFMKHRIDESLVNMKFSPVFNISSVEYKPMAWFEEEVFANAQIDFFASRPTEYTKYDKPISSNDLF